MLEQQQNQNENNNDIEIEIETKQNIDNNENEPIVPPPTAIQTPLDPNMEATFNKKPQLQSDLVIVKNKLERHSQRLSQSRSIK